MRGQISTHIFGRITAFLTDLTILAVFAAVVGALGYGFQQRLAGVKAERNKQAAGKIAAVEDRFEMDREATAAERKAAGMTDDEARAEAMKWSKR